MIPCDEPNSSSVQFAPLFPRIAHSGILDRFNRRSRLIFLKVYVLHPSIEILGAVAAFITTVGWIPQVAKIARERRAGDISLVTTGVLAFGILLWALYGILIGSWPVILANGFTFMLVAAIVAMKLRYG